MESVDRGFVGRMRAGNYDREQFKRQYAENFDVYKSMVMEDRHSGRTHEAIDSGISGRSYKQIENLSRTYNKPNSIDLYRPEGYTIGPSFKNSAGSVRW